MQKRKRGGCEKERRVRERESMRGAGERERGVSGRERGEGV